MHPAYLTLIEQLSAEEAFIFVGLKSDEHDVIFSDSDSSRTYKYTGKMVEEQFRDLCDSLRIAGAERAQIWLDNLVRLGLVEIKFYAAPEFISGEPSYYREPRGGVVTEESHQLMLRGIPKVDQIGGGASS